MARYLLQACFLMALQPGIFGKYWLVPIILLGGLVLSTYTLGYTVLRRLLHISKLEYAFVSTLFVLMTVQFVWSFYDAFFWYNGAMYYTLYYRLSLFVASLLIEFHLTKSIMAKIIITLVSAALRHIHCRRQLCYRSGYASHSLYGNRMDVGGEEEDSFSLISILMIYACAFAFSVFAPGNTVRQATVTDQPNVVSAFFMAIGKSVEFLADAIGIMEVLMFTILIPFLARLAKASRFKFSHPWLYLLISFLLYSAFFFPNSYAIGSRS